MNGCSGQPLYPRREVGTQDKSPRKGKGQKTKVERFDQKIGKLEINRQEERNSQEDGMNDTSHNLRVGQSSTEFEREFRSVSPQVRLYNRHFYLWKAQKAMRQEQYDHSLKELARSPKITASSYDILAKKIWENIKNTVRKHSIQDANSLKVDFQAFKLIIAETLGHSCQNTAEQEIFTCQLWLVCCRYQLVHSTDALSVEAVLRILSDPYNMTPIEMKNLVQKIPNFAGLQQKRLNFIDNHPDVADQTLEVIQIFQLWNKSKYENPSFPKRPNKQSSPSCFNPQISQRSRQLAEKQLSKYLQQNSRIKSPRAIISSRSSKSFRDQLSPRLTLDQKALQGTPQQNLFPSQQSNLSELDQYIPRQTFHQKSSNPYTYHDLLYERKLEKDQLLKTLKPKEDEFQARPPQRVATKEEISKIVDNLSLNRVKMQDMDHKKLAEERELKQCTFQPKINAEKSYSPLANVKGFQKDVNRMQEGWKEKKRKEAIYQNLGKVRKKTLSVAPSFIERDAPKLIIEVKIASDRIEKIHLKGDEDPKLVAKKFILKHALPQTMQGLLQELIQDQLFAL